VTELAERSSRKPPIEELPNKVSSDPFARKGLIKAVQANFDHLMGQLRAIARGHNVLVDDVDDVREQVTVVRGEVADVAIATEEARQLAGTSPPPIYFPEDGATGMFVPPSPAAAAAGGSVAVELEDSVVVAAASSLDFDGGDFAVTDDGSGEARIALDTGYDGVGGNGAYVNRSLRGRHFFRDEDFVGEPIPTSQVTDFDWAWAGAAGSTAVQVTDTGNVYGLHRYTSNGASTGRISVGHPGSTATKPIGQGIYRVGFHLWLDDLSDGTDTYFFIAGITDGSGGTDPNSLTDGIYFFYQHDVNGGDWAGRVESDNVLGTDLDTNVAVTADALYWLEIEVNDAASSAEFFINHTSVGSISSGLPDSAETMAPFVGIRKTLGSTARSFVLDYAYFLKNFSTPR
jgi:hypothetical protein